MTQVVSTEVRWRRVDPGAPGPGQWSTRSFPAASDTIALNELQRGVEYQVQARNIGANGRASDWVPATVQVPDTNRRGALALPTNVVGNQSSMWNIGTNVTYAAVSPTSGDSEATISVSAAALVVGSRTINYGPSSASITGAPGTSKAVYLYYDDPRWQGGSRPLGVTDNIVETANVNGRVALTSLTLEFPEPGGSGGGGGDAGGGGGGGGAHDQPHQVIQ